MAEHAPSERLIISRHRSWERFRLAAGAAAFVTLLIVLPGGNPLPDARASLKTLRESAGSDLRARRLAGRGPAYDRRFFQLVLAARDALPPGSSGVALYAPGIPEWGGRYLAIYEFAPVPVVAAPFPVPAGWVSVVYGSHWPAGLRLVRSLPGGALLAPAP
jgi:hypothetical protein